MSKISLEGNVSGSGTFTIASPNSNSNFTLTLPQATTTVVGTDATQTLTNKSIVATQLTGDVAAARITTALNASGTAPLYACRAWVNFNGTTNVGGFCTIRASGNVSSVADNGTGDYTVNFTTAMPDADYSVNVTARGQNNTDSNSTIGGSGVTTTSSARVFVKNGVNNLVDSSAVNVAIFR